MEINIKEEQTNNEHKSQNQQVNFRDEGSDKRSWKNCNKHSKYYKRSLIARSSGFNILTKICL